MLTRSFEDLSYFETRRKKLSENFPNSVFVFFSGKESHLSRFRARSSFVYFSGFEEPEAALVIRTGQDFSYHLFVRDKDPAIEIWDGERYGVDLASQTFGANKTHSISELSKELPQLMRSCERVFYSLGDDSEYDDLVLQARRTSQQLDRRSGKAMMAIEDPRQVLNQLRVIKDDLEIQCMKESCRLSSEAHKYVMKNIKPGMNERQVQALLFFSFYDQLASKEGYSSIIASGANACTLHYRANNRDMLDGDFLLIDAGAEKNYYTADITRTYPVNGRFTSAQKDIYQAVLDTQEKLITQAEQGFSIPELHESSCRLLSQNMIDLNLIKGSVDEIMESGSYKKYYPHGVGHYLGMDVHDVGLSKRAGKPEPLAAGMTITIEPGIYVPADDESAPAELQGLGVRIEDDILITNQSNEVMTALTPKTISDLEAIIGVEV